MPVTIKLFEFTAIVRSATRTTVLFPAKGHSLVIERNGRLVPVPKGANLEICQANGKALAPGRTEIDAEFDKQVPEINAVQGTNFQVNPAVIDPASKPVDALNAKLHFSGGSLSAEPCSIDLYRNKPFEFAQGKKHFVTDTVLLNLPGNHYSLKYNGGAIGVMELKEGDTLKFNNADVMAAKATDFADMSEYVEIVKSVLGESVGKPVKAGDQQEGLDNVCANAWIDDKA